MVTGRHAGGTLGGSEKAGDAIDIGTTNKSVKGGGEDIGDEKREVLDGAGFYLPAVQFTLDRDLLLQLRRCLFQG